MMCPIIEQPLVVKTISTDTHNYNQKTDHGQAFPSRARTVINAATYVGSTSIATYAYTVGTGWPAGAIPEIVINGEIQGKGGDAGNGGFADWDAVRADNGTNGGDGGPALDAQGSPKTRVYNNGAVRGGGGGGPGSGGATGSSGENGGCGGGGGRGFDGGAAGSAGGASGTIGGIDGGVPRSQGGNNGTAGAKTGQGTGGAAQSSPSPARALAGAGGDGGVGGSDGSAAGSSSYDPPGANGSAGSAGSAGACTRGTANLDWIVTGTRQGTLG